MSSVLNLIKNLPQKDDSNVINDLNYIRKSAMLVNDALQKGSDIMQMPNGDIFITEVKTVTYKYIWSQSSNKFERATKGNRQRKRKNAKNAEAVESSDTVNS